MEDPRFAHIKSDPRFRRMPKAQKKAKIDKRFNALFTSKKFKVRTDIDKRGRPVIDVSKRSKHVMERFYDLSDDDHNNSEEDSESISYENNFPDASDDTPPSKTERKRKLSAEDSGEEGKAASKSKRRKSDTLDKVRKSVQKKDCQEQDSDKGESESDSQDYASDDDDEEADDHVTFVSEESADSDDDSEEDLPEYTADYDIDETEVDHQWNELHTDAPEVSESTRRLAVCNMDWDFVKAQDLFVLFKSFAGEGGGVKSVAIYPSEYGKQRMSEEALLGPKEMRNGTSEADGVNEVEDIKSKRRKNRPMDSQMLKKMEKQKESAEREKLREYQLNRLQYYYAVVDCDSVSAADNIYKECDGMEYQLSAVKLDLRFIPDDMTFEGEAKEMFTDGNSVVDYQPTVFNSTALSQAKVEVTWDETDFDRLSKRIALLAQKELESVVEKNEYADVIAPPESDSEDERPDWLLSVLEEEVDEKKINEEEKIQLYRKVLMDKIEEETAAEKEREGDVDQEIEWQPGLKTSVEKKLQSKKHGHSSIVGEYLDKKKEKKKKKKLDKKKQRVGEEETEAQDGNEAFSDDDLPEDMDEDMKSLMASEGVAVQSVGKKKKKKMQNGKTKAEGESDVMDEKEKAELELLMMDEPGQKNLAKPEMETGKKLSRRKKKKLAKLAKEEKKKQQEEYVLDIDDPRFSALYSSHHFHIDPTAPQYKETKNMKMLVNQQIKKRKKRKAGKTMNVESNEGSQVSVSQDSKAVSKQLLESLKKKMKKR